MCSSVACSSHLAFFLRIIWSVFFQIATTDSPQNPVLRALPASISGDGVLSVIFLSSFLCFHLLSQLPKVPPFICLLPLVAGRSERPFLILSVSLSHRPIHFLSPLPFFLDFPSWQPCLSQVLKCSRADRWWSDSNAKMIWFNGDDRVFRSITVSVVNGRNSGYLKGRGILKALLEKWL